jgi:hypothetical protein
LKLDGILCPKESKTVKWESFKVPTSASNVKIRFDYTPRMLEGIGNHVNLLVYDSLGHFMGRYDRDTKDFVIGVNASAAAKKTLPLPGMWKLALENHYLFSKVRYNIEIEFSGSEEYTWYEGELHTHSVHSDGIFSVSELNDYMKSHGFDFFFLTDHSNITGWRELTELKGSIGFPGEELNTFSGHALALGCRGFVDWKDENGHGKLISTIQKEVKLLHGLIGVAHPFLPDAPVCVGCAWKYPEGPFDLDFGEVWSGQAGTEPLALEAINEWIHTLRQGKHVTATAGRDFHRPDDERNWMRTFVRARRCELSEIIYGIKRGMVYLSTGPKVYLDIKGKGPGEEAEHDGTATLRYRLSESQKMSGIVVTKNDTLDVGKSHSGEIKLTSLEDEDFALLIITRENGLPAALTNPIYLKKRKSS